MTENSMPKSLHRERKEWLLLKSHGFLGEDFSHRVKQSILCNEHKTPPTYKDAKRNSSKQGGKLYVTHVASKAYSTQRMAISKV